MEAPRAPHVHEATLELAGGIDPAEVGAAVTVELCGHWEHDGPCRWPHNNSIETDAGGARFRTLFVASDAESQEVHDRMTSRSARRRAGRCSQAVGDLSRATSSSWPSDSRARTRTPGRRVREARSGVEPLYQVLQTCA